MKRGKEDEKVVGPMFPRLHVNDTEKGGPRAPPRNKMALYEQFSIPSQRFNPHILPLNPNSNSSSSYGNGTEGCYISTVRLPSQTPTHRAESNISCLSDGAGSNTSLAQLEQRKNVDRDDFRVYNHSRIGQSIDKILENFDGEKLTPVGSRNFGFSVAMQNDGDRDPTQFGSLHVNMRVGVRNKRKVHSQVCPSRQQPVMSVKDILSSGEIINSLARQAKVTPDQEDQDCSVSNISQLHQGEACSPQEYVAGSQCNDIEHGNGLLDSTRDMDNGNALVPRDCSRSAVNQTSPLETTNDTEYHDTMTASPIQKGSLDESDDLSKISTVENLSSLKLSPDDIVRIIGQKQFLKARRKISNQQRVFAVQVFELHRLMKVQQLFAGSSDLFLEDGSLLGKFPPKGSTPKNFSLEVVVEPQPQNLKWQDDSKKLNHKMECSAENAVGKKTSFSSQQNGSHLSNYTPFSGNPHQANVAADNRMNPWCFNQSPGHQWLIPVMSPSEGLLYKPYPGPGFTGTIYGGCGPFGQVPLEGTFMNPPYGVPVFHQAIGGSHFIPPGCHSNFPPHGMPAMSQSASGSAVEQVNQFATQGSSHGQNGHSSVEGANFNTHNQSSCNFPVQRNGSIQHVKEFQPSKERELQGSAASSPSEMARGIRTGKIGERRDAHSPSLMAPLVSEGVLRSLETRQKTQVIKVVPHNPRQKTQVIKVVPHNPRSATKSAARIFQSIQEERKQCDLV